MDSIKYNTQYTIPHSQNLPQSYSNTQNLSLTKDYDFNREGYFPIECGSTSLDSLLAASTEVEKTYSLDIEKEGKEDYLVPESHNADDESDSSNTVKSKNYYGSSPSSKTRSSKNISNFWIMSNCGGPGIRGTINCKQSVSGFHYCICSNLTPKFNYLMHYSLIYFLLEQNIDFRIKSISWDLLANKWRDLYCPDLNKISGQKIKVQIKRAIDVFYSEIGKNYSINLPMNGYCKLLSRYIKYRSSHSSLGDLHVLSSIAMNLPQSNIDQTQKSTSSNYSLSSTSTNTSKVAKSHKKSPKTKFKVKSHTPFANHAYDTTSSISSDEDEDEEMDEEENEGEDDDLDEDEDEMEDSSLSVTKRYSLLTNPNNKNKRIKNKECDSDDSFDGVIQFDQGKENRMKENVIDREVEDRLLLRQRMKNKSKKDQMEIASN